MGLGLDLDLDLDLALALDLNLDLYLDWSDLKMATVAQFDPKTSESHDTRKISDLKTAADHQFWNKNRSGSSTLEHKCVSVVKKQHPALMRPSRRQRAGPPWTPESLFYLY